MLGMNGNGNGGWKMHVIGALWVCLLAVVGVAWGAIDDRLTYVERNSAAPTRERMASLETEIRNLEDRLDEIQQQLIRIEMRMIRAGQ
jgi:uncharacterized membrane-anchored protein YhcB (DUF1043 family)